MLDRRKFLKFSTTGAAVAVLAPSTIMLTGCNYKADAQAALDTLIAIYNANPTAPWAADLQIAIQDATTAIADWNGSSVNCELQSAFQIAGAILDSIPLGGQIDLIVTIALAGINVLLSEIAPCTATGLAKKLSRAYNGHLHSTTAVYQTYYAKFHGAAKWHQGADIRNAFNAAAKSSGVAGTK
jgi:hypothetical protein